MGLGVAARALGVSATVGPDEGASPGTVFTPRYQSDHGPGGEHPPDYLCEQVGDVQIAPFSCSGATIDFLRVNVLRNPGDIQALTYYGIVEFERRRGTHAIPVDRIGRNTPGSVAKNGSIVVPDGLAFIVTDFQAFALQTVMGLPGATEELDTGALALQVCFAIVRQNGRQALSQRTLLNGQEFCNGTPFLRDSPISGYPALTETSIVSLQPQYQVRRLPFPGFPDFVGARVKGYMIEQQLLAAAQSRFETIPDGPRGGDGEVK